METDQCIKLKKYMKAKYGITDRNIDEKLAELKNEYYTKVRRNVDGESSFKAVSG